MPKNEFSDDCPGCRPAMLDVKTQQRLPDDSPLMQAVNRAWDRTDLATRKAWHAVTCQNSRLPSHLALVQVLLSDMQAEMARAPKD